MTTFGAFLIVYVLGGITFIPLLIGLTLCHAYFFLPVPKPESPEDVLRQRKQLLTERNDTWQDELAGLPPEIQSRNREPDVAAGYFAVCREYVPGGVNGKPPERTTPAGAVVAVESPSVYQSMYRSIFDRGKVQGPTIEAGNGTIKTTKKARNVFYVVLRLGHLMLYDDAEQLEVRHVLALSLYDIDVYAGGEPVPEGELWVKRNCIRLKWKDASQDVLLDSKPFYLFSDNCSDKEDFYHALLQNQDNVPGHETQTPVPLGFDAAHIVKLVQQLHASEENLQTRWINALIGRLFLSLYKTADLQRLIHSKITKKISRVPKPTFIESIMVKHIDLGDSAPLLTNPKLRELTIDGDLTIEGDIKYKGNLRIEIAAVARLDLGPRFKARRVDLLLAGICKSLEGHVLIRLKPPPSNRIWFTFESMPRLDLSIEPIVSSRQITYGIILRAIESRIREVIGDTLVLPNWDDVSFSDTSSFSTRGGIWTEQAVLEDQAHLPKMTRDDSDVEINLLNHTEKSMSTPALVSRRQTSLSLHSTESTSNTSKDDEALGKSSSIDMAEESKKPRNMRSNSFATAASVSVHPATAQAIKSFSENPASNATQVIKDINSRSQPTSPLESPAGSPPKRTQLPTATSLSSSDLDAFEHSHPQEPEISESPSRSSFSTERAPSLAGPSDYRSLSKSSTSSSLKRQSIGANAASATAAAKKWGFDLLVTKKSNLTSEASNSHRKEAARQGGLPDVHSRSNGSSIDKDIQPIGRGQPLPPVGTPLPGPPKSNSGWTAALSGLAKRKPVPTSASIGHHTEVSSLSTSSPPPLPQRPSALSTEAPKKTISLPRPISGSTVPRRKIRNSSIDGGQSQLSSDAADDVLVIEAPNPLADTTSVRSGDHDDIFLADSAENNDEHVVAIENLPSTNTIIPMATSSDSVDEMNGSRGTYQHQLDHSNLNVPENIEVQKQTDIT